jgi:PAS domain S-box-containing protein
MPKREPKDAKKRNAARRAPPKRKAEATDALDDPAGLLRQILDCMGEGVVVAGKDGAFRLFNPAAERIIGLGAVEAPPEEWPETYGAFLTDTVTPFPPDDQPIVRAIRGEKVSQMEMFLRNGNLPEGRFIDVVATPLLDGEGEVQGGIAVVKDITPWKQAEGELRSLNRQLESRAEERQAAILQAALDCIIAIDHEGRIIEFNPAAEKTFGYSRAEALGKPLAQLVIPPSVRKRHERSLGRYLSSGESSVLGKTIEITAMRADGSEFPVELTITVIPGDGPPTFVGFLRDVSEQIAAREAARLSEEWLATTLSSIGDAVIATDAEGRVKLMNAAAQTLTGWSREDAEGRSLAEVFRIVREGTDEAVEDPVARVIREGGVVGLANHTELIARDRKRRPIDDSGAPIRDSEGKIIGVVLVFRDASETKQYAEELRRLTARLMELQEEERRQFSYDIHDGLGQLVTAASLHLEAFVGHRARDQEPAVEAELETARSCVSEAVMEMRRIVSELGPLQIEEMGLAEACRAYLERLAERAGWETEFENEIGESRIDPIAETALFRILQEALSNVSKHAAAAKVRVAFRRDHESLAMTVQDWGRGFEMEAIPTKPERGRYVGLLGMRERAGFTGGEFHIESAPGKGTTVSVSVPAAPESRQPLDGKRWEADRMGEPKNESGGRGGGTTTVLIADDHPMVREGLRSMLASGEVTVIGEAATGAEAIERTQELNPQVLLMDVRMPDMDGLAATEIIKDRSPETSVIVITSYESKEYLRRAIEAGAAGYLLKGMSRERLLDAINLVTGGGSLIDSRLLSEMLKDMGVEGSRFVGTEGALEALTPREQEVLQLLVRGLTNKEIASEMHYSMGTVKNVVQRVIEKLGVSDRTQAAVYAVRAGVDPASPAQA